MRKLLKKILPRSAVSCLRFIKNLPRELYEQYLIRTQPRLHRKAEERLRKKEGPINVVFFAIFKSVWKYDSLYKLLEADKRFHPVVLVCPRVNFGREEMLQTLNECYHDFKARGYNVVCAYDEKTDTYVDARSLEPDIIFYTNPYPGLIDDRYYITHFRDVLTCYVNYSYNTIKYQWGNALCFHKILWRYFCEEPRLCQLAARYQNVNKTNCVVSGYPTYDDFLFGSKTGKDWKKMSPKLKRIIWAPHHTIETADLDSFIQFSTFFQYAYFMQEMAKKYEHTVQFVFKPHPLLKSKLYKHPDWGQEKTEAYYDWWLNGETTNYVSGDYTDLFNSSDALIHDCASFTIEYLYTQKPVMYLSAFNHLSQLNEVAKEAFSCHYIAENRKEIEEFIENTVIKGIDPMLKQRKSFYNKNLIPPNNKTVAENILHEICSSVPIKQKKII